MVRSTNGLVGLKLGRWLSDDLLAVLSSMHEGDQCLFANLVPGLGVWHHLNHPTLQGEGARESDVLAGLIVRLGYITVFPGLLYYSFMLREIACCAFVKYLLCSKLRKNYIPIVLYDFLNLASFHTFNKAQ